MPFIIPRLLGAVALGVGTAAAASAAVINADYDTDGAVQSGAVGVLSTTGTFLNSVEGNGVLRDEFGNPTGVCISSYNVLAIGSVGAGTGPELFQDTNFVIGPLGANVDNHDISGLIAGTGYDLAFYGWSDEAFSSAVEVQHAGDTASSARFGSTDPELPGTAIEDYVLFPGLQPRDLGGSYGFTVRGGGTDDRTDTVLAGFQISGEFETTRVPVPASLVLMLAGTGSLGLFASRRRARQKHLRQARPPHHLGRNTPGESPQATGAVPPPPGPSSRRRRGLSPGVGASRGPRRRRGGAARAGAPSPRGVGRAAQARP
ncbi:MAG: VPLPA-CTERM sorting domain-containing protein [Paracoccaceae bacterium]|jgi:hypothetical protein|nr:VPLPA-CTERM sorting domain-containing protein [Paracoccaceae bacterium]